MEIILEGGKAVSHDVDVFHALKMPPLPGQSRSLLQMREVRVEIV